MDDVRLTPAERRALSRIEGELRKDRDLDRAMRRMRLPGTRRRPLLGRGTAETPDVAERTAEDAAPPVVREVPDEPAAPARREEAAKAPDERRGDDDPVGDRRRMWMLTVVVSVVLAAVLTVGTPFFLLYALILVTLAATAGVVWIFVALSMRRPDTG